MMRRTDSITALPVSPEVDRRRRMTTYLILMGIRLACIGIFIVVPGWWKLVPALGAVFIPYVAVTLANATSTIGTRVEHVAQPSIEAQPPASDEHGDER